MDTKTFSNEELTAAITLVSQTRARLIGLACRAQTSQRAEALLDLAKGLRDDLDALRQEHCLRIGLGTMRRQSKA